ncbi:MAG: helix-turn-helix domain-containing protein [Nitrospina sp.]|nr:helix-turn-helix domain-containing protein [Nitrospina sp.]
MSSSITSKKFVQDRHLLDYKSAAEWLGIRPQSLRRWVSQRRIPFKKLGRVVRFDADELQSWIDSHSIHAEGDRR